MIAASANISPQQRKALEDAAQWHVELSAESVTENDRQAWQQWLVEQPENQWAWQDRKSTRLNSSHVKISYAVFCLKKKKIVNYTERSQAACIVPCCLRLLS